MNGKIVGVGCFGKAEKFNRFFEKMMSSHVWGPSACNTGTDAGDSGLLNALTTAIPHPGSERGAEIFPPEGSDEAVRITGFFLTLKEDQMRLWVYTRTGAEKSRCHTIDMQRLSRIRPRRLH